MKSKPKVEGYSGPGGSGSARAVTEILRRERVSLGVVRDLLFRHNKPEGYACASCAWAKPAKPHPLEFCESGAKATAWELTSRRVDPEFLARHALDQLERWSDHGLEESGRLTHPMRWDAASNSYVPVAWGDAFAEIGRELRGLQPPGRVLHIGPGVTRSQLYVSAVCADVRQQQPAGQLQHVS